MGTSGKCLIHPEFNSAIGLPVVPIESKDPQILTCSVRSISNPLDGNYVLYDIKEIGDQYSDSVIGLDIFKIEEDYCLPEVPSCSYEELLNSILTHEYVKGVPVYNQVDEIHAEFVQD